MEEKNRDVSLNPARMKPAEYNRNVFSVSVEHDVTKKDLMLPQFWAHVAASMKINDRIEANAEDGSFYAELLVVACDRNWAKVHLLSYHDLTNIVMDLGDDVLKQYEVKFKGPKGWCVIRKADNEIIQEKLHSEKDAQSWLEVHLKQRKAA